MPRGYQWNPQALRQPRAQDARLAWPRDVDNLRAECTQLLFEEILVSQEGGIEGEILFQTEGDGAAPGNLQRGQLALALLAHLAFSFSRMETEKGKTSSSRKGFKVAAGVGHPVDFVKCVGEVGHSGGRAHRQSVSARGRVEKN